MIPTSEQTLRPTGNSTGTTLPSRPRITPARIRRDFPIITFLDSPEEKFVVPWRFKGIAADFDGTMMKFNFTEGFRQEAFRLAIDSLAIEKTGRSLPYEERDRTHREAIDRPEGEMCSIIARQLSSALKCPLSQDDVMSAWTQYFPVLLLATPNRYGRSVETAITDGIIPFFEVAQTLGIPTVACSNGYHELVISLIKAGTLDRFVNFETSVFTSLHPEISIKPDPDPYLLTAKKIGINPWELLVLEDSATGALSALRAGAQVVLQPSGDRDETLVKLARAIQIHHPNWIAERANRIIVLSEEAGFTQLVHEGA